MEREIVQAALQGNEKAFEQIYYLTFDKACAVAYGIAKDYEDAVDIVQESYVKMWEKLDTLDDPARLESWFNMIVKRRALDFIKSAAEKNTLVFADMEAGAEDESFNYGDTVETNYRPFMPEESVDYAETQRILWGIVNELPDKQRECVILRFQENMKIREIADATGYNEATVKSCLKYGQAKIAEAVKKLEKEGTKLYSFTPFTLVLFLRWILGGASPVSKSIAAANIAVAAGSATAGASAAAGTVAKGIATGAAAATAASETLTAAASGAAATGGIATITSFISAKTIAIVAAAAIAIGGVFASVIATHPHEKEIEQVVAIQMETEANSEYLETEAIEFDAIAGTEPIEIEGTEIPTVLPTELSDETMITSPTDESATESDTNSSEEFTEGSAAISTGCEHDWSYSSGYYESGNAYEERTCNKCGAWEHFSDLEDDYDSCEHDWVVTMGEAKDKTIFETSFCTKCGITKNAEYVNTCNHVFEEYIAETPYPDGSFSVGKVCTNCRYGIEVSRIYPTEDTAPPAETPTECEHNMVMTDQIYGSEYVNEWYECTKCGATDFVAYPNPCQHEGELQSDFIVRCIHCGIEMGCYPPEEIPTEVPTELPAEAPTECEHDWSYFRAYSAAGDLDYEDRTCDKCGAYEVTYNPADDYACNEHDWVLSARIIGDKTISETSYCTKCGLTQCAEYVNTCNHVFVDWRDEEPIYDGSIRVGKRCTICGYGIEESRIYPDEETTPPVEESYTEVPTETSTEAPATPPTEAPTEVSTKSSGDTV